MLAASYIYVEAYAGFYKGGLRQRGKTTQARAKYERGWGVPLGFGQAKGGGGGGGVIPFVFAHIYERGGGSLWPKWRNKEQQEQNNNLMV